MKDITFLVASALLISGVAGRTFTVCIVLLVLVTVLHIEQHTTIVGSQ